MTTQTYYSNVHSASRPQLKKLSQLYLSRVFSDAERQEFAEWIRSRPTVEQASQRIDEALGRVNDPQARNTASVAQRVDSLAARIEYQIDKGKPIDHAAEARAIGQQLRQQDAQDVQAAQAADEAEVEADPQPSADEVDAMAEEYAARLDWESEALSDALFAEGALTAQAERKAAFDAQAAEFGEKVKVNRIHVVEAPLVPGASDLWPDAA